MGDFVVDAPGPDGLFGVFEDDGETGYLYIYEPDGRGVLRHLQIYNRAAVLGVREEEVRVTWALGGSRCGVFIWGGLRGVIALEGGEGRAELDSRDSPPLEDPTWTAGFEET